MIVLLNCAKPVISQKKIMKQSSITNVKLQAQAVDDHKCEYRTRVEIFVFEDSPGVYVAYCPSLDLSTSDDSFNGALSSFYEALQLHIEYCVESGTSKNDFLDFFKKRSCDFGN